MRQLLRICAISLGAALSCWFWIYAQTPPGPLAPQHEMLNGPGRCNDCHSAGTGEPRFKCLNCHEGIKADQKSGKHPSLGDSDSGITSSICAGCHSLHVRGGVTGKAEIAPKNGGPHGPLRISCGNCHTSTSYKPIRPFPDFKHSETSYPLRGMHAGLDCRQCHTNPVFLKVGKQCADCHADFHRRQMGSNCEQCHTVRGWRVSLSGVKNHANRFPLLGAHATTDCQSCHKNGAAAAFRGLSTECASCHKGDYASSKSPDHASANFPTDCRSCHTGMDTWRGAKFDHGRNSGFVLSGGHSSLDCSACHQNRVYAGTSKDCAGCHEKNYSATANPKHAAAGFPRNCTLCHSPAGWAGAKFDHAVSAGFQLTGGHSTAECRECHADGRYAGTSKSCYSCHSSDFSSAKNPVHTVGMFSTDCSGCHTVANWSGGKFDHNTAAFKLTGAHSRAECSACHKNGVYAGTSTACASCHLADYDGTRDPNHSQKGFPQQCSNCHNTESWTGATFDHATTAFPLTGAHTSVQCSTCHKNNVYTGLSAACSSCHLGDYNATTNPNHTQAGFPQQCTTCHNSTVSWAGAAFNHGSTPFPLTGAHTSVQCSTCHKNNVYAGLSTACASCHLGDYNATTNPSHSQAGFPQQCSTCHTTVSWPGATFSHGSTPFPLTGAHTSVQCSTCHKNNVYAGLSTACVSCHLSNYSGAANPNHVQAGFPQDCTLCHSTAAFTGAVFDHAKTQFPLTGSHTGVGCTTCHKSNVYAGLGTACISCHSADYNGTTNPSHVQAGFPQQCSTCHDTTSWAGAVFNHGTTQFPLTGAHTSVQCNLCHINGKYAGTPTDCYSCHSAEYKTTTNPGHTAAGFPTTCATCHTTVSWTGASFNHTWWSRSHGGAKTCGDCHPNPSNYTVFTCTTCHTKSQTDSRHAGRSGYVYNSANCYQCHRSGGN